MIPMQTDSSGISKRGAEPRGSCLRSVLSYFGRTRRCMGMLSSKQPVLLYTSTNTIMVKTLLSYWYQTTPCRHLCFLSSCHTEGRKAECHNPLPSQKGQSLNQPSELPRLTPVHFLVQCGFSVRHPKIMLCALNPRSLSISFLY